MKPQVCTDLKDLVANCRKIFEDDHVNVDEVMDMLASYKSNRNDWLPYAKFDPHKYTRNLVDQGNGKYNLMILCWGESMGSSIHDHADCHCFVKVLNGKLKETLYEWPKEEGDQMVIKNTTVFETDGVSYMSDALGLHRMENPSHTDPTVTLHLYVPGYDTCHIFDERTGHASTAKVTFWSKYGEKVDYSTPTNATEANSADNSISAPLGGQNAVATK